MIWLTWRQFRPQAIAAAGGVAVVVIVLAVTRLGLTSAYTAAGLSACHAQCATAASIFLDRVGSFDKFLDFGTVLLLLAAPALMGLFWGAPLISREIAEGTHRIAWNQSVTRTRWTIVKLGLVGLAAVATAGLLCLIVTWWASPIDAASLVGGAAQAATGGNGVHVTFNGFAEARLDPVIFDARGVAPLGYAALAFALGVTAGVLLRRTLPAMAVTLVSFAVIQVLVPNAIRPHLLPPAHFTAPLKPQNASIHETASVASGQVSGIDLTAPFAIPGAWVLSDIAITPSGAPAPGTIVTSYGVEFTVPPRACIPTAASGIAAEAAHCRRTLAAMHLRQSVTYQPASRFWPLQWIETGIYLLLAAGLGWVCVWQVRRRRTP
jgi:hypothetical protein